ncbi:LacI family DNA-binding transcriptional regulator [Nakamurella deserti]|uniref:LacI family DNA-binding transcriptional regulator n=1 Tax=Nakamurella deserti TaxID=2164074 RepID=UPI000DBE8F68|nr:LacI family DNA-binding transcriptional regulator [Nakamurella deserti]
MGDAPHTPPRRAATRSDVARAAGVSTAVVSYVINGGPRGVAPATAARVRAAIETLDYRPNLAARALRTGTTEMIGLVVPDSSNPFYAEYAVAVERRAAVHGHALVVANSGDDPDRESRLVEGLAGRRLSGVLLATTGRPAGRDLTTYDVPMVLLDRDGPVPGFAALGPAFTAGAAAVVGHLVDRHGLSSVALCTGRRGPFGANSPEQGWREALDRRGLDGSTVVRAPFDRAGGYAAGRELLTGTLPDAVFAASDLLAVGVLRALHEGGLRVPEDIAVVSFDGTSESEYSWPTLTVARQPVAEMAGAAVDALLAGMPAGAYRAFDTDLVIRRSCGCPT